VPANAAAKRVPSKYQFANTKSGSAAVQPNRSGRPSSAVLTQAHCDQFRGQNLTCQPDRRTWRPGCSCRRCPSTTRFCARTFKITTYSGKPRQVHPASMPEVTPRLPLQEDSGNEACQSKPRSCSGRTIRMHTNILHWLTTTSPRRRPVIYADLRYGAKERRLASCRGKVELIKVWLTLRFHKFHLMSVKKK